MMITLIPPSPSAPAVVVSANSRPTSGGNDRRRLVGNAGYALADQIIRCGCGAVVLIALSRHLGPRDFGSLSLAVALTRIFAVAATLGLERVLVRRIILNQSDVGSLLSQAWLGKFLAGGLLYTVLLGGVSLLGGLGDSTRGLVAVMGLGLIFQAFDVTETWWQAREQMGATVLGRSVPFALAAASKLAALAAGAPLLAYAWLDLGEMALGAIVWVGLRRYTPAGREAAITHGVRDLPPSGWWRPAGPLLLTSLSVILAMKLPCILVGEWAGRRATGLYTAAAQVAEVWNFLPMALAPAALPFITRARSVDPDTYWRRLHGLFFVLTLLAYALALTVSGLSAWLVSQLYGPAYAEAGPALRILIWSLPFTFLGVAQGVWDLNENRVWLGCTRAVAGVALTSILGAVLVPRYGLVGAAGAVVSSYVLSAFVWNAVISATRPVFALQCECLLLLPLWRALGRYFKP